MPGQAQMAYLCAEPSGDAPDELCDWEVTGSDVDEVIRAAREHLALRHGLNLSAAGVRRRLHELRTPIHRRVRGV